MPPPEHTSPDAKLITGVDKIKQGLRHVRSNLSLSCSPSKESVGEKRDKNFVRRVSSVPNLSGFAESIPTEPTKQHPIFQALGIPAKDNKDNSEGALSQDNLKELKKVWELQSTRDSRITNARKKLQAKMNNSIDKLTLNLNAQLERKIARSPVQLLWHNLIMSTDNEKLARVTAKTLTDALKGKDNDSILFKNELRDFYISKEDKDAGPSGYEVDEVDNDTHLMVMRMAVFNGIDAVKRSFEIEEDKKDFNKLLNKVLEDGTPEQTARLEAIRKRKAARLEEIERNKRVNTW